MEGGESQNGLILLTVHGTENIEDVKGELGREEDEVKIGEPPKNEYKMEEEEEEKVKQKNQPLPQEGKEEVPHKETRHTRKEEEQKEASPPRLTIMVVGKVGVGKSTLINAMLGKKVAKVSQSISACNHNTIEEHTGTVCGIPVVFYDTRGLGDPELNSKGLMNEFKQKLDECGDRLTVLICQRFSDKLDDSVERFAELLAIHFENDYTIWKNCIFVLTQANKYDPDDDESDEEEKEEDKRSNISPEEVVKLKMNIRMKEWAIKFRLCLRNYSVPEALIMNMPVCLAGNKKKIKLPLTDNWIETIMNHYHTRALPFQSAHQMKRTTYYASLTIGTIIGGIALPLIGLPIGFVIGKKVANSITYHSTLTTASQKEQREFREKKIDELAKGKDQSS